jgi:hypothetical protein
MMINKVIVGGYAKAKFCFDALYTLPPVERMNCGQSFLALSFRHAIMYAKIIQGKARRSTRIKSNTKHCCKVSITAVATLLISSCKEVRFAKDGEKISLAELLYKHKTDQSSKAVLKAECVTKGKGRANEMAAAAANVRARTRNGCARCAWTLALNPASNIPRRLPLPA